jgi:hypothetical protein
LGEGEIASSTDGDDGIEEILIRERRLSMRIDRQNKTSANKRTDKISVHVDVEEVDMKEDGLVHDDSGGGGDEGGGEVGSEGHGRAKQRMTEVDKIERTMARTSDFHEESVGSVEMIIGIIREGDTRQSEMQRQRRRRSLEVEKMAEIVLRDGNTKPLRKTGKVDGEERDMRRRRRNTRTSIDRRSLTRATNSEHSRQQRRRLQIDAITTNRQQTQRSKDERSCCLGKDDMDDGEDVHLIEKNTNSSRDRNARGLEGNTLAICNNFLQIAN